MSKIKYIPNLFYTESVFNETAILINECRKYVGCNEGKIVCVQNNDRKQVIKKINTLEGRKPKTLCVLLFPEKNSKIN
jgi:hypothetical protein